MKTVYYVRWRSREDGRWSKWYYADPPLRTYRVALRYAATYTKTGRVQCDVAPFDRRMRKS